MYSNAMLLGLEFSDQRDCRMVSTHMMTEQNPNNAEHLADLFKCFHDDKVALDSFFWLAEHIGTTCARLIDKYATWRLTMAQPFTTWRQEEGTYLERFVRAFDLPDGGEVVNVVRNLRMYDFYTSPVLLLNKPTLVGFDYHIGRLLAAMGDIPVREDTWLLFERSEIIGRNPSNSHFIDKPSREIPKSLVFKKMSTLDFDLRDDEYAAIARWHITYGDGDLAKTIVRRLLERDPDSYEANYLRGIEALDNGQLVQATLLLQHAIKLRPEIAESHLALANAFLARGNTDNAVGSIMKALAFEPQSVEAHYNLGISLADLGKFDGAIVSFQKVIELRPHFSPAFYGLGECLNQSGQLGEAAACYERALELWPEYEDAQVALAAIRSTLARVSPTSSPGSLRLGARYSDVQTAASRPAG